MNHVVSKKGVGSYKQFSDMRNSPRVTKCDIVFRETNKLEIGIRQISLKSVLRNEF